MLRYIKVNNKWIDTMLELKNNKNIWLVIDNIAYFINSSGDEYEAGPVQDERDY